MDVAPVQDEQWMRGQLYFEVQVAGLASVATATAAACRQRRLASQPQALTFEQARWHGH